MKYVIVALAALAIAGCTTQQADDAAAVTFAQPVAKSPQALVERGGPLRFAIIGDRTGGHRPDVFGPALEKLNLLQPELVMSVGDFIEGYAEDEGRIAAEWDEVEAMVERLEVPLFYVAGNHDISNRAMLGAWEQRRGPSYYAFRYKGALFLALSTEDPPMEFDGELLARTRAMEAAMARDPQGTQARILESTKSMAGTPKPEKPANISDAQVEFARAALAANSDVRWTFVFMHKPAWQLESRQFERIEDLLADRDYTVFAGHEHYYAYERRRGRDYVDLATTGGVWLKDGAGRFDHVTWVTLAEDGPRIANLALSGISGKQGPAADPE